MKFINYLSDIVNVEIYPLISLIIFVLFFVGLVVYVIMSDKNYIKKMSDMPLDNNDENLNYSKYE
jgi:cytochrome c oxidase cbb3-type subunit 4